LGEHFVRNSSRTYLLARQSESQIEAVRRKNLKKDLLELNDKNMHRRLLGLRDRRAPQRWSVDVIDTKRLLQLYL
jgi:hypothetical protein